VSPVTIFTPAFSVRQFYRIDDFLKIFHRKTFFNNERKRQIFRFCATHRNIIYRSENRQFANVSAFKKIGETTKLSVENANFPESSKKAPSCFCLKTRF
jgi:hypothetical protein